MKIQFVSCLFFNQLIIRVSSDGVVILPSTSISFVSTLVSTLDFNVSSYNLVILLSTRSSPGLKVRVVIYRTAAGWREYWIVSRNTRRLSMSFILLALLLTLKIVHEFIFLWNNSVIASWDREWFRIYLYHSIILINIILISGRLNKEKIFKYVTLSTIKTNSSDIVKQLRSNQVWANRILDFLSFLQIDISLIFTVRIIW